MPGFTPARVVRGPVAEVFAAFADVEHAAGHPKQFGAGKAAGYAVWEEKGVWHLRVTSKDDKNKKQKQEDRVVFSGRVVVEGDKVIGKFEKLEKAKAAGDADWVFAVPVEGGGSPAVGAIDGGGGVPTFWGRCSASASATMPRARSRRANSVSPRRVSSVVATSRRAISRMASADRAWMRAASSWALASSSGASGSDMATSCRGKSPSSLKATPN